MPNTIQFDYIIVGAGSAGAVLANRLSASGRHSVLLLEAGGSDNTPYVQVPLGYGKVFYDEAVNWKYLTEPVPQLNQRQSYWPRGKVLGGSSSINAMVYVRGHPEDYEQWNQEAPGWGWADVEPLFRRMELWQGEPSQARGDSGPLSITDIREQAHPLCDSYILAAQQLGIPWCEDYNAGSMTGATHYQITTQNGRRASTARAYLRKATSRQNLVLRTHAHVTQLIMTGKRVSAVEYQYQGARHIANVRADVVLAAGAVNSPHLLQLSGIGPADVLQRAEIEVKHDLPAVGRSLSDHLGADLVCKTSVSTLNQELGPWFGKARAAVNYLLRGKGPLSLSLNQAGGFIHSSGKPIAPDLQLYFSPVSYTRAPVGTRPLIQPDPFPGFLIGFNPCKPTSKGYIEVRSPDPFMAPRIQPNYLSTDHDQSLMLKGMQLMRDFLQTPALSAIVDSEVYPGSDVDSPALLMDFVRQNAWTVFHPSCTCKMGQDKKTSVVNERLNVHGIQGLRIADASIFPTIPTGNTNAPAIMVGEKASSLILQDAT